jgi:hypothetical protein
MKNTLKRWLHRRRRKEPKLIYLRFAKCAGTFLNSYFDQYYPDLVATVLHVKPYRTDWCLQDFAGKFENYYKFALVRNPWDWQVSYYFHLRQSWQNPRRELFCKEFPSFEEWLKNSERHTLEKFGGRFCWENELFDNICHYEGRFLPDYVGKVETLSEDIHEILRINNIEIPCSLDKFQQENKNRNFVAAREKIQSNVINATKHEHYSTYYTDELIDLVARHNRNIISRNNYEFEDRRVAG